MSRLDLTKHLVPVKFVANVLCRMVGCSSEYASYFYDAHDFHWESNAETTLKIILIPSEDIIRIINETVRDDDLGRQVYLHFSSKLSLLNDALKKSNEFLEWLRVLPPRKIGALFESFSVGVSVDKAKLDFKVFVQSLASEKIQNGFFHLAEVIPLSVSDLNLYTLSVALYEVLLNLCPPFFENHENSAQVVFSFVDKLKNILNGLESFPFPVSGPVSEKFDLFMRDMFFCLQLLQVNMKVDNSSLVNTGSPAFTLPVIPSEPSEIVSQLMTWLTKYDEDLDSLLVNKQIIVKLFEDAYRAYLTENEGIAERYTTNALTAVAAASSLFSSASARFFNVNVPVLQAPTQQCNVDAFLERIKTAEMPVELRKVISELFILRSAGINFAHNQFVSALIKQFLRETVAKSIITQMQQNFRLSLLLVEQLNRPMLSAHQLNRVADFFIQSMHPQQPIVSTSPKKSRTAVSDDDLNSDGETSLVEEIDEVRCVILPASGDALTAAAHHSPRRDRTPTPSLASPRNPVALDDSDDFKLASPGMSGLTPMRHPSTRR